MRFDYVLYLHWQRNGKRLPEGQLAGWACYCYGAMARTGHYPRRVVEWPK